MVEQPRAKAPGDEARSAVRNAPPSCPQCQRPMAVRVVSPVLFAPDVDDVTYACARCRTETKRSVKRT